MEGRFVAPFTSTPSSLSRITGQFRVVWADATRPTVPAGGSHELTAGGDHVMLMGLTAPLEAGFDMHLTKPVSPQALTAVFTQPQDRIAAA